MVDEAIVAEITGCQLRNTASTTIHSSLALHSVLCLQCALKVGSLLQQYYRRSKLQHPNWDHEYAYYIHHCNADSRSQHDILQARVEYRVNKTRYRVQDHLRLCEANSHSKKLLVPGEDAKACPILGLWIALPTPSRSPVVYECSEKWRSPESDA